MTKIFLKVLTLVVFTSRSGPRSEQMLRSSSPILFLNSSSFVSVFSMTVRDRFLLFLSHLSRKSPSVSDPWACWWRLPRFTAKDSSSSSLNSPSLKSPSTEPSGSYQQNMLIKLNIFGVNIRLDWWRCNLEIEFDFETSMNIEICINSPVEKC